MSGMVSVIIPLYNSEKYIVRCIESVINQSYNDLEIIIIDDNSNDKSSEIVKRYLNKYDNIKYIKNEVRLGASQCRNIGLLEAESQYVLFLDSDDWIDLNCLKKAVEKFDSNSQIDIVVWEIKTALHNMEICKRYQYLYDNILTSNMAISLLTHTFSNEFFLSPLLGCKLFKTKLIKQNNITFIDTFYEDDIFSFLAFYNSEKIGLITGCSLYYYQHPASLTHNFSEKHVHDLFVSFDILYQKIIVENGAHHNVENYYKYLKKCIDSLIERMNDCVSNYDEQNRYKTLIFEDFSSKINVREYYEICSVLTI